MAHHTNNLRIKLNKGLIKIVYLYVLTDKYWTKYNENNFGFLGNFAIHL